MDTDSNASAHALKHYLDWLSILPWGVCSDEKLDLARAEAVLDREHFGLHDVKNQVLELVAMGLLRNKKRAEVDATAVGAAIYREYTRPALEWWMDRYSQSTATPKPMREALNYWMQQRPAEMEQWFAEQPESPQRDALNAAAATSFTAQSKFQNAAQRVEQISDPKIRQAAVERLNFVWAPQDAAAAAAWRATQ